MDRSTLLRTGIAGTVAGLGMAMGGVAVANADDPNSRDEPGFVTSGRIEMHGGPLADDLAEQLGIDADKVEAALEKVHETLRPEEPDFTDGEIPAPPSEEEMEEHKEAFEKALADALGISQARVEAAFEALRAEVESEHRDALVERLDAAVEDGTLTEADKASVLKAYDAGVIGGPLMGRAVMLAPGGFGGPRI